MWNEARKRQFLAEKSQKAILSQNLQNAFNLVEKKEAKLNKDIAEFTSEEIIEFYKYLTTPSIQSLIQLHTSLTEYCNWCMSNGLIPDNQNHFLEIRTEVLCGCIDSAKYNSLILSREQLLSTIKELPNYVDRFIFLGIFEGIPVKGNVLYNVKMSDLNGNNLTLSNGKTIEISDELVKIMVASNEEETYQSMGKTEAVYEYIPSDNIIRLTISKRVSNNTLIYIGNRFRTCCKYLGLPEGMTIKMVAEGGRIHLIKEIAALRGISPEEVLRDQSLRASIEERYGKIQNIKTYIETNRDFLKET